MVASASNNAGAVADFANTFAPKANADTLFSFVSIDRD
jgi:hypothetical protein